MNSLQVILALGLMVIVSSLPIEFNQGNGDLKLTINDIFTEINDVLKRDLNEQLNKDAIDFGDKVNTTTSDGGKLQVQVQHFNSANGFPVFFKPSDDEILDDKKVSQVVAINKEHETETSTSVTYSTSKASSAPKIDVSKSTDSSSTTSTTHSVSSLETVSTTTAKSTFTIVLPQKVSPDSITKAPISIRSIEQSASTTTAVPSTTRISSSSAVETVSTTSVAPAIVASSTTSQAASSTTSQAASSTTLQAASSTTSPAAPTTTSTASPTTTTTTKAPETTTSGNIFLEAFDSFASLFQSKPEPPAPTTTHAPSTTTVAATTSSSSGSVSTSTKQSDVAEVPTTNSPTVHIVELKKDIAAVPVIFTQV